MRALRLLGLIAVLAFTGCGDDDNPDAVDVKNLKYPQNLSIVDNGDGSVTLSWNASNFEKEFEGYNVYASALTDADIAELADQGLAKGVPLQLLDGEGDPSDESKAILAKLDYDSEEGFAVVQDDEEEEEPSTSSDADEDEDEPKFSFLPIHNTDADGEAILPTCYPSGEDASYTCTNYDEDNVETVKDEDDGELIAHGTVSYDVSGLAFDTQYCFLIFTVQDSGEEISQTSTNFECIRPKYKFSGDLPIQDDKVFAIKTFSEKCAEDGVCPETIAADGTYIVDPEGGTGEGTEQLAGEALGTGDLSFTPGLESSCGIKNFGYRPLGFNDTTLPNEAPAFDNAVAESDDETVANSNGYSPRGQSIIVAPNFMYILACEDSDDTVLYYWIHVTDDAVTSASTEVAVDMRLSATAR